LANDNLNMYSYDSLIVKLCLELPKQMGKSHVRKQFFPRITSLVGMTQYTRNGLHYLIAWLLPH